MLTMHITIIEEKNSKNFDKKSKFKSTKYNKILHKKNAPDWTRTNDAQLRTLSLYPTELPRHILFLITYCRLDRAAIFNLNSQAQLAPTTEAS